MKNVEYLQIKNSVNSVNAKLIAKIQFDAFLATKQMTGHCPKTYSLKYTKTQENGLRTIYRIIGSKKVPVIYLLFFKSQRFYLSVDDGLDHEEEVDHGGDEETKKQEVEAALQVLHDEGIH